MESSVGGTELTELADILDRLNAAESFEEASDLLLGWARGYSGAEVAVLRLREKDDEGQEWVPACRSQGGSDDFLRDESVVEIEECLCGRVASGAMDHAQPFTTSNGSFYWGEVTTLTEEIPQSEIGPLRGRCIKEGFDSVGIFPLGVDEPVGALLLTHRAPNAFAETSSMIEAVSRASGRILMTRQQHEREQSVLSAVQSALLPPEPPSAPGLEVGVCFSSATNIAFIGGDFYDVVDLKAQGTLILVGDYSGKGIDAAGNAAQARYAITTLARRAGDAFDLSSLIGEANELLADVLSRDRFVSLMAYLIRPDTGEARVVTGGHPPPLLLVPASDSGVDTAEAISAPRNPPLGPFPGRDYGETAFEMENGAVLLVYTDGITDARRNGVLFGIEGVAAAAGKASLSDPRSVASTVCEASRRHHDPQLPGDDRLVLAVRRIGSGDPPAPSH